MKDYGTPIEIAKTLSRHSPCKIEWLLEPAVGKGSLLSPLFLKAGDKIKHFICIDRNSSNLRELRRIYKTKSDRRFKVIQDDFLEWSFKNKDDYYNKFDCVLMNPPFSGRLKYWQKIIFDSDFPEMRSKRVYAPLEVSFILRAIGLLKPSGTLLTIVPAAVISSMRTIWLRQLLIRIGHIKYVHELPKYSFKGVEARIYLLVYQKSKIQGTLIISNHDLKKPRKMKLSKKELDQDIRLDYSFLEAKKWLLKMKNRNRIGRWKQIREIARIYRGSIESPIGVKIAIHTTDYNNGFWGLNKKEAVTDSSEKGVRPGDLLVKRVGDNPATSVGRFIGRRGIACSDCVLILRPKNRNMSTEILLATRVLLSGEQGPKLLERGTGATYISQKEIGDLIIPIGVGRNNLELFKEYKIAIQHLEFKKMQEIEFILFSKYLK